VSGDRHASGPQTREKAHHVFDAVSFGDQHGPSRETAISKQSSNSLDLDQQLPSAKDQLRTIVPT
jgi:hypothetical protein